MTDQTEETTKPVIHVLMLIDMSGSMSRFEDDVIGGFSTFVDHLRKDGNNYRMTVTLFNSKMEHLALDIPLESASFLHLDDGNYITGGMTALNDAIGNTLTAFDAKHGDLLPHEKALVVVNTDGAENASRRYTDTRVIKKMIDERVERPNWDFVWLGAGPDAFAAGYAMGLNHSTVSVGHSSVGTSASYGGLATGVTSYASGMPGQSGATVAAEVAATEGITDEDPS